MIRLKHAAALTAMLAIAGGVAAKDLRAVAEDGRKVLLSADGRWRFDASSPAAVTPASDSPYRPSAKQFAVAFNPSDWTLQPKRDEDGPIKRGFVHKSLPVHAWVIADEMPATTPTVKTVILTNAKNAGAETTVLLDEIIRIGGKEVGSMRMSAALKGMDFMFWTYYFADEAGNIQVTCFTAQALFYKYEAECRKFLSSLSIG